jgi:hypothetical protein
MTSPLPAPRTVGWSPKAVVASLVALALSVLLPAAEAAIEHVTNNPELLGGLAGWVRTGVLAALVALGTLLAAYRARPGVVVTQDATRGYGAN